MVKEEGKERRRILTMVVVSSLLNPKKANNCKARGVDAHVFSSSLHANSFNIIMIALKPTSTSTCYLFELERKGKGVKRSRCTMVKRGASKEEEPQHQSSSNIQILPQDIMMDILSRLPIYSLLQCTLVSKAWRDTIRCNNSIFATMQHNRTMESQNTTLSLMFFLDDLEKEDDCTNLYLIQRGEVGEHRKLIVMDAQFTCFNRCFRIMGACNGLLCFSAYAIGGPAFVSNPITRECLMLPSEESLYKYARISGFGFALAKKEYKVVRMVSKCPMARIQDDDSWKAEIYTLGTNAWRQLKNVPASNAAHLFRNFSDVLVNGSLHWFSHPARSLLIFSLDMDREEFGVVPAPKFRSIGYLPSSHSTLDNSRLGF
ncbi:hypothetical protein MRB53_034809 [Persea americana]|uniref:Uncharacterized protein n=1 Tax=Persea americana TaxID=3435 RepID=A0ACC2K3B1_PERAE|nr:hypothetical protein MRB53_034809 [Persea americana]